MSRLVDVPCDGIIVTLRISQDAITAWDGRNLEETWTCHFLWKASPFNWFTTRERIIKRVVRRAAEKSRRLNDSTRIEADQRIIEELRGGK